MSGWAGFDAGASIGSQGSEQGVIVRDHEHAQGARVTLERDGVTAPWSITCGVYGWMAHTCFYAERAAADRALEAIKRRLEAVLDAPDEAATSSEIERFVRDHP